MIMEIKKTDACACVKFEIKTNLQVERFKAIRNVADASGINHRLYC